MASQDLIQQLIGSFTSDPDLLSKFIEHPYSVARDVSGNSDVSRDEVSQAVAGLSLLGSGQQVDFSGLADLASKLLSQNDGSAHTMAESLLGAQSSVTPDIAGIMQNLSNVSFEKGIAGVDLSDGFGIDDMMGIAANIFGFGK